MARLVGDADATDPLAAESLALAGLASAAVRGRLALGPRAGARVERLGHDLAAPWIESSQPLQAGCDGFDLHAGVTVAGDDRHRLAIEDPAVIHRILMHLGISTEAGEPLRGRRRPEEPGWALWVARKPGRAGAGAGNV